MENSQQKILSEIKEMISSIRSQIEQLDAKMAQLQFEIEPQTFDTDPIDISLDDLPVEMTKAVVVTEEVDVVPVEQVESPVLEDPKFSSSETIDDDLPFFETEDTVEDSLEQPEPIRKQAVIDAMTAKQAWRTDMPGAPVRDIRSAISLNDRVLFINRLFDEDPVSFQEALSAINQMSVLDDAVTYLVSGHPSWDLDSEIVYRFMMALRRKIN